MNKAFLSWKTVFPKRWGVAGLAPSAKCRSVLWVPNETALLNSVLVFAKQGPGEVRGFEDLQRQIFSSKLRHLMSNSFPSRGLKRNLGFPIDYTEYCFSQTDYAKV